MDRRVALAALAALVLGVPGILRAAPVTLDFEDLKVDSGGAVAVSSQYARLGVVFNDVAAINYAGRPGLARSGSQVVEQCYGAPVCSSPLRATFSTPVARVRVWVGYSSPIESTYTLRLRALGTGGDLLATRDIAFPPARARFMATAILRPRFTPVSVPMEVAMASASIQAIELVAVGARNGIAHVAVDDFEFEGPPLTSDGPGPPTDVDLALDSVATSVAALRATLLGRVTNQSPHPVDGVVVNVWVGNWTESLPIVRLSAGERRLVEFTTTPLAPGTHAAGLEVRPRALSDSNRTNNQWQGSITLPAAVPRSDTVTVPDVRGLTEARAGWRLRNGRLVPGTVYTHSLGIRQDVVEDQEPLPGRRVRAGSTVALTMASLIRVPDLRGGTLDSARARLARAGLVLGTAKRRVAVGPWAERVDVQDPGPGVLVAARTPVGVEIVDPLGTWVLIVCGLLAAAAAAAATSPPALRRWGRWEVAPGPSRLSLRSQHPSTRIGFRLIRDSGRQTLRPRAGSWTRRQP